MNLYGNFKSPLGYQTGESQIDTYGVDHSGFSTRDELEYQFARQNKENQLIQNYNNQGITKNYPQYGTNFWGSSPENNYGFGTSKIHDNIENMNNNPFENTVNTFGQNQTEQSYGLGSENQTFGQENNNSTQWGLNSTPLAQNNNNTLSGNLFGNNNLFNQTQSVWNKNQYQTPTPWTKQSASFGNNLSTQTKPVYENPNPQGYSAGDIAWSALEGFVDGGKAIAQREAEAFSQLSNRLTSLERTAHNLANNYNLVMNSPQEFQNQDPISVKNSTLENAINFLKQYKLVTDKKLSDVNKHQYMSCLAGKDGLALGVTGLALGAGKEVVDLTKKYFNEEQNKAYGGWSGIWADSVKDMNNNIKGFVHGFVNNQPCYPLLKKALP